MFPRKEFYFVRHGQTDYNLSLAKIDHEDVSLNLTGQKQAHAIEPLIATLPIQSVCYSPLKRAKETKEIITSSLSVPHLEIAELGECSMHVWNEMTRYGLMGSSHPYSPVKTFMQQVLQGVSQALTGPGPVLIVAHGGIHWVICCLMNLSEHEWMIDNCLPVHFVPTGTGGWQAKRLV